MRVKVIKKLFFSAAHALAKVPPGHQCRNMHGHNYTVIIECAGELNVSDMVIDFQDIGDVVKPLIRKLDHQVVNDVVGYHNPTSEWLCRWFVRQIADRLPLCAVEVWETDTAGARVEVSAP